MGISLERELNPSLKDLLRRRKKLLFDDWFRRILDGYAGETAALVQKQQDRFANPVAYAFRDAMESVFTAVTDEEDADLRSVDYAVKIRAVQEKDPGKGVAFIYLLKDAVREKLGDSVDEHAWAELDRRISRVASIASGMFVVHRRKIDILAKRATNCIDCADGASSSVESG